MRAQRSHLNPRRKLFLRIEGQLRISIVSYTNTIPFRWGLTDSGFNRRAEISEDIPSECARKLLAGEADLALVPVAILPELGKHHIVSRYCIGADGIVDSVKLYAEVPVNEVKEVLLDYQSRTSVALARILFEKHWRHKVRFTPAEPGFEQRVGRQTAAVVIGDRTFAMNGRFKYDLDLADEWKKLTGLPFVFAAWTTRTELPAEFLLAFNNALAHGVEHIRQAVEELPIPAVLSKEQATDYLEHRIDYHLDARKQEGLDLFLRYLNEKVAGSR